VSRRQAFFVCFTVVSPLDVFDPQSRQVLWRSRQGTTPWPLRTDN
jgi:hypothetical protein